MDQQRRHGDVRRLIRWVPAHPVGAAVLHHAVRRAVRSPAMSRDSTWRMLHASLRFRAVAWPLPTAPAAHHAVVRTRRDQRRAMPDALTRCRHPAGCRASPMVRWCLPTRCTSHPFRRTPMAVRVAGCQVSWREQPAARAGPRRGIPARDISAVSTSWHLLNPAIQMGRDRLRPA